MSSSTNTANAKQPQSQTNKKEPNDIRIGQNSRVRNVVRYCNSLLKEKTYKTLHFSAVGGAIGKLVSAVEVLKTVNEGLYQQNKLATVSYQSSDAKEVQNNQKLYPKMEVILSLEDFKDKTDGYQKKLDETERQKLYKIFNEQPVRRGRRGGFRGRRGGFIGRRGGFRGRRGFGFRARGFRGGNRGRPMRGNRPRGMRGNRGSNREGNRGSK